MLAFELGGCSIVLCFAPEIKERARSFCASLEPFLVPPPAGEGIGWEVGAGLRCLAEAEECGAPTASACPTREGWLKVLPPDEASGPAEERLLICLTGGPAERLDLRILGRTLFAAACWHTLHGSLMVHSAAVAHTSGGYLFLGDSGAGKTSVAQMSASAGYHALGDDLNFVLRSPGDGYLLAAAPGVQPLPVGYALLRPPLRGIMLLVQDGSDYLVPLPKTRVARALFDGFLQTPSGRRLPKELVGLAFRTCCAVARAVPGYELHFRKSPDFWRVIDAEFGA